MDRREFLATTAALLGSSALQSVATTESGGMQYRTLGHTGERVSIIGVGGYHIGTQKSENESIRIIRTALDNGVNFLDNCWDYNDGASEIRMGKALRDGYRHKAFLMTKIDGRDGKTAAQQIDESLRRFQTERIDLMQFHEIIRMEDAERIFAAGGALEATLKAKQAGKVRYIGFTGHKSPDIHLHMLKTAEAHKFTFDSVQMPLNVMDAHFNSFGQKVLPVLVERKIGVLGMKPIGSGMILDSKTVSAVDCLRYALSLPTSVVITGCDSLRIMQQAIDTARNFRPLSHDEVAALLAKTEQIARAGEFEKYKTSRAFDGTHHNPQWLGPAAAKAEPST